MTWLRASDSILACFLFLFFNTFHCHALDASLAELNGSLEIFESVIYLTIDCFRIETLEVYLANWQKSASGFTP